MDLKHLHKSKSQVFFLQELIRNSSQFAMTRCYDEACISVSVISKQCFQNLDKNKDWDNGSNHVFVINSQFPNDLPFGGYIPPTSYKAIFAQTFQMKCWYRQGMIFPYHCIQSFDQIRVRVVCWQLAANSFLLSRGSFI